MIKYRYIFVHTKKHLEKIIDTACSRQMSYDKMDEEHIIVFFTGRKDRVRDVNDAIFANRPKMNPDEIRYNLKNVTIEQIDYGNPEEFESKMESSLAFMNEKKDQDDVAVIVDISEANPTEAYYVTAFRPLIGYLVETRDKKSTFLPPLPYGLNLTPTEIKLLMNISVGENVTTTSLTKKIKGTDGADKNYCNALTSMMRKGIIRELENNELGPHNASRYFRLTFLGRMVKRFI